MSSALLALTIATALGCATSGGALFAFSSFVMPALDRLPAPQAIAAMQSINLLAVTPVFMTALFGSGLLCVALIVVALAGFDEPYAGYLLAGALVYLIGIPGLTMAYNVPRNNALERLDRASSDAAGHWARFLREWTRANHVRAAAGIVASGLLIGAVHVG
jgi:uncharacterized membrane protein